MRKWIDFHREYYKNNKTYFHHEYLYSIIRPDIQIFDANVEKLICLFQRTGTPNGIETNIILKNICIINETTNELYLLQNFMWLILS